MAVAGVRGRERDCNLPLQSYVMLYPVPKEMVPCRSV